MIMSYWVFVLFYIHSKVLFKRLYGRMVSFKVLVRTVITYNDLVWSLVEVVCVLIQEVSTIIVTLNSLLVTS